MYINNIYVKFPRVVSHINNFEYNAGLSYDIFEMQRLSKTGGNEYV